MKKDPSGIDLTIAPPKVTPALLSKDGADSAAGRYSGGSDGSIVPVAGDSASGFLK
jgi:hypothetical protein